MKKIQLYDIYGTVAEVDHSRSGYIRIDFTEDCKEGEEPKKLCFSMQVEHAKILKSALNVKIKEHDGIY